MRSDGGAGLGGDTSEVALRRLLAIATDGGWEQRIDLADTVDLPPEVYRALVDDEARVVIVLLAQNRSTPREVLETLAQRDPALNELVDLNPNAAPARKERVELWKHTQVSLERYFDEMELDAAVRNHILDAWMGHSTQSLAEVLAGSQGSGSSASHDGEDR